MKRYYKLQEAYEQLQAHQSVYHNQTYGRRYFVVCTEKEYWDNFLSQGDIYGYEVIQYTRPCHLHIDLDINYEKYPDKSYRVERVWLQLEEYLDTCLAHLLDMDINKSVVKKLQFSSSYKKGSMHIVYNVDNFIFESNLHVGKFMRDVRRYVVDHGDIAIFDNGFVDMAIYTPNRMFRMLGCTKWGKDRILTNHKPFTFENWRTNKVQPVESRANVIDVGELDVKDSTSCGTSNWNPLFLKPALDYIAKEHSPINRVFAFPMDLRFACNMDTRYCPFLKRNHTSNGPFVCINMREGTFRVKCHSKRCEALATDKEFIPAADMRQTFDFLNTVIKVGFGHISKKQRHLVESSKN